MALPSLEKLSLEPGKGANELRPDSCTEGTKADICTNLVRIIRSPTLVYRYGIEFGEVMPISDPQRGTRQLVQKAEMVRVLKALKKHDKLQGIPYAFLPDGTFLFTAKELKVDLQNQLTFKDVRYPKRAAGMDTIGYVKLMLDGKVPFKNQSIDLVGAAGQLPTHPDTQAMLNAFVQMYPSTHPNIVKIGSNRFFCTDVKPSMSEQLDPLVARQGYNLTVKAAEIGPGVIINTTTSCFLPHQTGNGGRYLLSELFEALRRKFPAEVGPGLLSHVLRGVHVRIEHDRGILNRGKPAEINLDKEENRVKIIEELHGQVGTKVVQTPSQGGNGQTLSQYVKSTYGITLKKDYLPAVNVGVNHMKTSDKAVWLPPELLSVLPHQSAHPRLQQLFVSGIIRVATRDATRNRDLIKGDGLKSMGLSIQSLGVTEARQRPLQGSGFELDQNLVELQGRILPPPKVLYGNGYSPEIKDASWNLAKVGRFSQCDKFLNMKYLPMLWIPGARPDAKKFERVQAILKDQLKRHGIRNVELKPRKINIWPSLSQAQLEDLARKTGIETKNMTAEWSRTTQLAQVKKFEQELISAFASHIQGQKVALALVVVPDNGKLVYGCVKRVGDLQTGVATACLNLSKSCDSPGYISNIIAKMNVKLGGITHTANMATLNAGSGPSFDGMVVMGADVVHLGTTPEMRGCPSIASVVGSCDNKLATYLASVRAQTALQEIIEDLKIMVVERLRAWQKKNSKRVPETILFFRDGVSDGQFEEVRQREIPAIQAAWNSIPEFAKSNMNLIFMIVSKRHATRFYRSQYKQTPTIRNENVKPGLMVDRTITHPYEFDFFLQAHQAIQGTARPAHYYVLRNDPKASANQLTAFTHMLHYLNGRATKGISYATPTFFADACCNHTTIWFHYRLSLSQGKTETRDAFLDRCRKQFLAENPSWNVRGRPGPWHRDLDEVMFYL